jgi:hypothetical protein
MFTKLGTEPPLGYSDCNLAACLNPIGDSWPIHGCSHFRLVNLVKRSHSGSGIDFESCLESFHLCWAESLALSEERATTAKINQHSPHEIKSCSDVFDHQREWYRSLGNWRPDPKVGKLETSCWGAILLGTLGEDHAGRVMRSGCTPRLRWWRQMRKQSTYLVPVQLRSLCHLISGGRGPDKHAELFTVVA